MKIVQKVKIGGFTYPVMLVPDLMKTDQCYGKVSNVRALIKIDEELSPDLMKATLLHEIFEALNAENEYNLPHRVITGLATQFYQVIHDNPEMFENEQV
jgi:hypothetical protein